MPEVPALHAFETSATAPKSAETGAVAPVPGAGEPEPVAPAGMTGPPGTSAASEQGALDSQQAVPTSDSNSSGVSSQELGNSQKSNDSSVPSANAGIFHSFLHYRLLILPKDYCFLVTFLLYSYLLFRLAFA